MKLRNSFFYTMREDAKDEDSRSGNLLVRAGMIKKTSAGHLHDHADGQESAGKDRKYRREEMDRSGAQELLMPALILEDVYEKSGRREAFGSNMFALKDRYQKNYVLGPYARGAFCCRSIDEGEGHTKIFRIICIRSRRNTGMRHVLVMGLSA